MKYKITIIAQLGRDSKAEIRHEIKVLEDITGKKAEIGDEDCSCVFEGEFHEFYQKVKDRIMRRIKAYE